MKHDHHYRSATELVYLLAEALGQGANLLLNFGPMGCGAFPQRAREQLVAGLREGVLLAIRLDDIVGLALLQLLGVEPAAGEHVLVDRHRRERVGALEHHADTAPHGDGVDVGGVQVPAVELHPALDPSAGDHLVHAVQRAEKGRLAAPGRTYDRGDRPGLHTEGDPFDRLELPVVDVEVGRLDGVTVGGPRLGWGVIGHRDREVEVGLRRHPFPFGSRTVARILATAKSSATRSTRVRAAAKARSMARSPVSASTR